MACYLLALGALLSLAKADDDWTKLTNDLNALIKKGTKGVYTGGSGVLVRNPFDGYSDDQSKTVVPATFWVNDIYAISQLYPNGDPRNPTDGAPHDDPWKYANVAFVVGSNMSNVMYKWDSVQQPGWGDGVFYAFDSNSCDRRCRWKPTQGEYDCPPEKPGELGGYIPWGGSWRSDSSAKGAGSYSMGNPWVNDNWGGGAGCHMDNYVIDQANVDKGRSLLYNRACECNYDLKNPKDPHGYSVTGNGWDQWVDQFYHVTQYFGKDIGASWNGDLAMCWMNNPRDMINLQNWLFWKRTAWSSEKVPYADYFHLDNYEWTRRYWGWNEVPVTRAVIQNPGNWDAVVIMVPVFVCQGKNWDSIDCLHDAEQKALDGLLYQWVQKGYMKVGMKAARWRPGSSVVIARQSADSNGNFYTTFFCQNWGGVKGGTYKIVHAIPSASNPNGGCWLDSQQSGNKSSTPTKPPTNPLANASSPFGSTSVMV